MRVCARASEGVAAPAAILWPDPERQWLPLISQLRSSAWGLKTGLTGDSGHVMRAAHPTRSLPLGRDDTLLVLSTPHVSGEQSIHQVASATPPAS